MVKAGADGWEEAYDPTQERSYWYNRKTRQRTWTSPGPAHPQSASDAIQQAWSRKRKSRDALRSELDALRALRDALFKQQEEYRRRIAEEYDARGERLARLERMRARFESAGDLPPELQRGRKSSHDHAHDIWGGAAAPSPVGADTVGSLPSRGGGPPRTFSRKGTSLHRICKTTGSRINMHTEAQQLKAKVRLTDAHFLFPSLIFCDR